MAQKNATPSRAQQEVMRKAGLNSILWVVIKDLQHSMIVKHRRSPADRQIGGGTMANTRVPNEFEKQIMRENGISDTKSYGVMYQDADCIRLLCHATRDVITIHKGDRKW